VCGVCVCVCVVCVCACVCVCVCVWCVCVHVCGFFMSLSSMFHYRIAILNAKNFLLLSLVTPIKQFIYPIF
jgi:hypothetical protein